MANFVDIKDVHVIAPNFKQRLSGVTSTIIQLVPMQNKLGTSIAVCGAGLPPHLPRIALTSLWRLWQKPTNGNLRVWHARRNIEMLPGIIMRDILRMKLKLVFTSAAQRHHTHYTKWLISKMDHVIATSQKSKSFLQVPASVVLHGIDLDHFHPSEQKSELKMRLGLDPDSHYIGCFGRVRHQKGTDLFVKSMIALLPKHRQWSAIISGRTTPEHQSFKDELQNQIDQAGLTNRIKFIGEVNDIKEYFQTLSLYIAPPRVEGFGLTPLEAAACGVPTIATDAGAFSEQIAETETGFVVNVDDLDALCAKADHLMSNPARTHDMGQAARQRVAQHFSLQQEASAINKIYPMVCDSVGQT